MNVAVLLSRAAARARHRPALSDGMEVRTYRELDARVSRLASSLRSLGLERGDRVGILTPNRPEALEALFATWRAGLAAVPIGWRLHPEEIAFIVGHAGCRALISGPGMEGATSQSSPPILIGPDEYDRLVSEGDEDTVDVPVEPDALAWLFYTSGTTGRPKGAMLTHRNLLRMTTSCLANLIDYRKADVVLHAAPLSHGAGLYAIPAIARAAYNVVPPWTKFEAASVLALIARSGVTVISFLTPTMLNRLVNTPDLRRTDIASLRRVLYGGGPAYVEDLRRAVDRLGSTLVQLYGQGESPMTISYLSADDHDRIDRLASVGIPHPDLEVRVVDEADHEVAGGQDGEICVRGDVVMAGYWNDPDATAAAIRDGWLHTGDIGRYDEAGYMHLLDRKKDVIISGGANIYPREVEEVLLQHPDVAAVAVVGIPDREWGESVHAFVVPRAGSAPSTESLIALCRQHLASYKKPRSIALVDELPLSGVGKVLKRALRSGTLGD